MKNIPSETEPDTSYQDMQDIFFVTKHGVAYQDLVKFL